MNAALVKHATHLFVRLAPVRMVLSRPFQAFVSRVYFRTWCPGGNGLVRDCIAKGECGCNNAESAA
jgi:hypothetical protein